MKAPPPSTSLERALAILELVAYRPGGLSNAEISSRMKMATSSGSYVLGRLERAGFLQRQPETGKYEIGLKVISLAHGALKGMGLRKTAEPVLRRLAVETDSSAIVGVLERGHLMIVDKLEKPDLAVIDMDIGVRYPLYSTALGKVLLAYSPSERVRRIFERYEVVKSSPKTIESKAELWNELELVRNQGYACSDGELFLGIRAVAAPILGSAGDLRAAVSATGFSIAVDDRKVITAVKAAAREISSRLVSAGDKAREKNRR